MWEQVDDEMAEVLRMKTESERLAISNHMWRSARRLILARLKQEHPEWNQEELEREVARRMSHGAV